MECVTALPTDGSRGPERSLGLPAPADLSVLSLLNLVLRSRRLIVALVGIAAVATVALVLSTRREYSSSAAFMPQSRRAAPNFSGIAAQLGIGLGVAEAGQAPQFYVDLLESREILSAVADSLYPDPKSGAAVSLPTLLRTQKPTPLETREVTLRALRGMVDASPNVRTGVIRLTVKSPSPEVSRLLAARLLEATNSFNLRTRQSQGAAERRFTERRLNEVRDSVRAAEDRLQDFLQRNRDYRNSPPLMFEHERLTNQLNSIRAVQTTIAQAYEQAKIEEVRDTPLITVIEQPSVAMRPDTRGGLRKLLLASFFAALLGLAITAFRSGLAGAERASEYQQFNELRQATVQDLRHPVRAFKEELTRRRRA
jgi:uncharacterized protein involved in exopolysaccharide biosynthesis